MDAINGNEMHPMCDVLGECENRPLYFYTDDDKLEGKNPHYVLVRCWITRRASMFLNIDSTVCELYWRDEQHCSY